MTEPPISETLLLIWKIIVRVGLLLNIAVFLATIFRILRKKYKGMRELEELPRLKQSGRLKWDIHLLAFTVALSAINAVILQDMYYKRLYFFLETGPRLPKPIDRIPPLLCVAVIAAVSIKFLRVALGFKASIFLNVMWLVSVCGYQCLVIVDFPMRLPVPAYIPIGYAVVTVALIATAIGLEIAVDKLAGLIIKKIKRRA